MELERLTSPVIERLLSKDSPQVALANRIGAGALRAFMGPLKSTSGLTVYVERKKLPNGEKIWESNWAIVMDQAWLDHTGSNRFTLVAPRRRRQRPTSDTLINLVLNSDYADPVAYIKPPSEGRAAVVIVGTEANNPTHLQQIWPIINEINGSNYILPEDIHGLVVPKELPQGS